MDRNSCGMKFDRSVEGQRIGSLALRLFAPGSILGLGQFGSCQGEGAFCHLFVVPSHSVTCRELGELRALLSPLAESLRLAQESNMSSPVHRRGDMKSQSGECETAERAYRLMAMNTIFSGAAPVLSPLPEIRQGVRFVARFMDHDGWMWRPARVGGRREVSCGFYRRRCALPTSLQSAVRAR
jgi:hypothetical protein